MKHIFCKMAYSSKGKWGGPEIIVFNKMQGNLKQKIKELLTEEEFEDLWGSYKRLTEKQFLQFLDTAGYLGGVWMVEREVGTPELITSWFKKETGTYLV